MQTLMINTLQHEQYFKPKGMKLFKTKKLTDLTDLMSFTKKWGHWSKYKLLDSPNILN